VIRAFPKPVILVCEEARAWIRQQPCLLGSREPCECGKFFSIETRRTPTECCHVRTRRAHGDFENLVPMCGKHHREQHRIGIKTFNARYGLNLASLAVHYWDLFTAEAQWANRAEENGE
jgi:hypothetical protein